MKGLRLFNKFYSLAFVILLISVIMFAGMSTNSTPSRTFYNREILKSELFNNCTEMNIKCRITAYCPGPCCNSGAIRVHGRSRVVDWSDMVAAGGLSISGLHRAGIDVAAVDPSLIPFGSMISFKGRTYLALDAGKAIKGRRIDLSMKTHESADEFGRKSRQRISVYVPRDPAAVIRHVKEIVRR